MEVCSDSSIRPNGDPPSFPKATLGCPAPGVASAFLLAALLEIVDKRWGNLTTNGVAVNSVAGAVWQYEQNSKLTRQLIRSRIQAPLLRKPLGGGGSLRA